jgi:hypothetical protein
MATKKPAAKTTSIFIEIIFFIVFSKDLLEINTVFPACLGPVINRRGAQRAKFRPVFGSGQFQRSH